MPQAAYRFIKIRIFTVAVQNNEKYFLTTQ